MPLRIVRTHIGRERGWALLVVVILLFVLAVSSTSFIWFMNQQQTRAGQRYRSTAAMALAEAGVHRALSILETVTPDDRSPGRGWRPAAYSETLQFSGLEGRFTISVADESGGGVVVTSVGEAGGVARRLRARVHLSARALLVALYASSIIRLEEPPAATFILPYGTMGDQPWVHLATGVGLWFGGTTVALNDPAHRMPAEPGPVDAPAAVTTVTPPSPADPIRVLLPDGAVLRLDGQRVPLTVEELRRLGLNLDGFAFKTESLPEAPDVDGAFFEAQAALNVANAGINEAAGKHLGDSGLIRKQDSLYSQREFAQLLAYLNAGVGTEALQGVVYVKGDVALQAEQELEIREGALVAEGTVELQQRASLLVRHSVRTRTLPGIVTLNEGELIVGPESRLRVHGLTYVSGAFDLKPGATADLVGSLIARDPGFGFTNTDATVVVRYDPAVLGTSGLRLPERVPAIAWVASWEEVP